MTAPHQNLLGTSGAVDTEETDPNFNQTVLLVHAGGSNGDQNNSFLDSSGNDHTIARNGTPTQGTFNPYLGDGQYSIFFNASNSDQIDIAHSSEFNAGTGAFTLEGFVYLTKKNLFTTLYSQGYTNSGGILLQTSSGDSAFRLFLGSNTAQFTLSAINLNEFVHIAIVRDGSGNLAGYINGVQDQTKTGVTGNLNNTSDIDIGHGGGDHYLDGYINSLRFIKGTNKYQATSGASNFPVPSTPFTNESGTSFLVCQSNRFIDNSTTGHTLTTNGTPKVVPFSPFAPTESYSESVHGGSGYFDGNGDYLRFTDNLGTDLAIGTSDFEFSAWLYLTTSSSTRMIYDGRPATNGFYPILTVTDLNKVNISYNLGGTVTEAVTPVLQSHQWLYISWSRVGSTTKIFVNGTESASTSDSANLLGPGTGDDPFIGSGYAAGDYFEGYICDFKFCIGRGITSQTVPTAPATSDSYTKILLNFTNASIIDHSMKHNLITIGDAQIDTSIKKFGTGSIEMDGTDDEVRSPAYHSTLFDIGNGLFTIEFFAYRRGTGQQTLIMLGTGDGNTTNTSLNFFWSTNLQIYNAGTSIDTSAGSLAQNQFVYVVLQRDASNISVYVDGTRTENFANTTTWGNLNRVSLGSHLNGNNHFDGLLDEIRVTRGIARYSGTSMTVPTKAHPNR